ncbi:DHBP synthase RibB-like alpha/beta domain-containing protein [Irpex lacteus]|nr:DHBP synthase RibB-like alpha/beta domain-containing protein [Irpex lacteus]
MATVASRTRVLSCDPSSISFPTTNPDVADPQTLEALHDAAILLQDQQVVAFPTETVYGLGALALDAVAAARIFSTKGRPADNPLIVHVSSEAMLRRPLTLLFPSDGSIVPSIITANQPTVAVRMPSHPVARALIAVTDAPIAAPTQSTRAEHVFRDLEGKLDLILDGGACAVGWRAQSSAQDWQGTTAVPRVLVHRRDYQDEAMEHAPTTPGMKYRHYSLLYQSFCCTPTQHKSPADTEYLRPLSEPSVTAQRLFDGLLSLEAAGVHIILIEAVAEEREGLAVMNRVKKAAGESVWLAT